MATAKWAGAYEGKAKVLEYFGRQAQATSGPPSVEIHDILGNDEHVVVLGSAKATAQDGSSAEWKYTQVFHIRDGKATEVWGNLPVVHVAVGGRQADGRYRPGRARGIIALGDIATGLMAVGGVAIGLISVGGSRSGWSLWVGWPSGWWP